jgi:LysM repeat protein
MLGHMKLRVAFAAALLAATNLPAQRADPNAVALANLREDVRILQQTVGELRFTVEQLQRDNRELAGQAESGRAAYVTLAQLNEAVASLRHATEIELAEQKRETIQTVGEKIAVLAKQTQAAVDALARGQASRPAIATQFNDDFPKEGCTYTVQAGESLSAIAKKFGVSMKIIQNANRLADPTKLRVGQSIFIPGAKEPLPTAPQLKP